MNNLNYWRNIIPVSKKKNGSNLLCVFISFRLFSFKFDLIRSLSFYDFSDFVVDFLSVSLFNTYLNLYINLALMATKNICGSQNCITQTTAIILIFFLHFYMLFIQSFRYFLQMKISFNFILGFLLNCPKSFTKTCSFCLWLHLSTIVKYYTDIAKINFVYFSFHTFP